MHTYTSGIVGQSLSVKHFPDVDEAAVTRRSMPETKATRAGVSASRPVTVQLPDVAVEPKRIRRFGAGF